MSHHYHITSNTYNALNDNEVICVETRHLAGMTVVQETRKLAMWLGEGCDRDGCGYCGWCQSSKLAAREVSPQGAALMARLALGLHGSYAVAVEAPGAPDGLLIKASVERGEFADCLDHAA